ncbi:YbhB/YbcL family Raf kinase inhibitor-like protein [Novosphingobium lentum]|uniref:YbhB/YbcL family Raf kinase inhibitor-like protein n=1 Tax=Novosphingobium lentum TaxID=145287 RepID=UPI00082F255E|nr:YbhB/YbcL family Raf kinase inhibitor-like protein [Novosphingobium lentum]
MADSIPAWLGRALPNAGAGHARLAVCVVGSAETLGAGGFALTSPAFADREPLDPMFTADEEDACAPPLAWTAPPAGTRALVLVVEDPDALAADPLVHLLGWGMAPRAGVLLEGEDPPEGGHNSSGIEGWLAPDPSVGDPAHDYVFQLFALDVPFELAPGSDREAVIEEMEDHVIAVAVLTATYRREEQ